MLSYYPPHSLLDKKVIQTWCMRAITSMLLCYLSFFPPMDCFSEAFHKLFGACSVARLVDYSR